MAEKAPPLIHDDLKSHFSPITRENLDDHVIACLGHGPHSPTRPIVKLLEYKGKKAVVKDYHDGGALARGLYGRWMVRREEKAYAQLTEVTGIPRFIRRIDRGAFMIENIEGEAFRGVVGLKLPGRYFEALRDVIRAMHAQGVIHLDLSQRKNFMIQGDGAPIIIDFGSAIVFSRKPRLNPFYRMGCRFDHSSLTKLETKYRTDWSEN